MTTRAGMAVEGDAEESITARLVALMDDKLAECNDDRAAAAVRAADALIEEQGHEGAEWVDDVIMRALVSLLKSTKRKVEKAPRMDVQVAWNGAIVSIRAPKVYAVPKTDDAGRQVWTQPELLIDCVWDDLRRVWNAVVAQGEVLEGHALVIRGLLELRDQAPGALTPRQACQMLGKDIESFTLTLSDAIG